METRAKLSEANKGENNPQHGKARTKEHCKKLSEALKGEKNPFWGKTHKKETLNTLHEQRVHKGKGYHYCKQKGKFVARIHINGKQKFIGLYKTEEEAMMAFREALQNLKENKL